MVYIQGILEVGLEVRCDAIERFELQMMPTVESKLQFNRRPCRHWGICINSVVVNAFNRLVTAKAHPALPFVNFFVFRSASLRSFSKTVTIQKIFAPEGTLDRGMILNTSNFFKFSISFMIACFHELEFPCLGYSQLTDFLHASNDIGSGS